MAVYQDRLARSLAVVINLLDPDVIVLGGGLSNMVQLMPQPRERFSVLRKRLTLRGFIVSDFAARQADFLRDAGEWVRSGRLKYREDVIEGLENAPAAFLGMLQGKNFGKMLVKVAP
jgi:NADPH-dependent curcumin reductase CurA